MKTKHIAAAIVSVLAIGGTLAVAAPAGAQDYRDGGGDYGRQSGRGFIVVRTEQGQFVISRRNPLFQRLLDSPFQFRPGFTYIYTDQCNRDGCMVIEQAPWARGPGQRFFAPYVRFDFASDEGDRGVQNDGAMQDDGPPPGDSAAPENQGSGLDSDARQAGGDNGAGDNDAPPPIHPSNPPRDNTTGHTSHDDHGGLLGGPN